MLQDSLSSKGQPDLKQQHHFVTQQEQLNTLTATKRSPDFFLTIQ